jgi:hypothetical protein
MNHPTQSVTQLTGGFGELGNGPLPIGEFCSPEYFAVEKERIFKKSWLRVGVEKQLSNAGSDFVSGASPPGSRTPRGSGTSPSRGPSRASRTCASLRDLFLG